MSAWMVKGAQAKMKEGFGGLCKDQKVYIEHPPDSKKLVAVAPKKDGDDCIFVPSDMLARV